MSLTQLLRVTSLARSLDGVYRESNLVRAQLARGLPDDVRRLGMNRYYDAFGSGGISCERAARLYAETARLTIRRKSSTFVVIASICVASMPATILVSF
ncbi:hypothetical protein [Bradyrhizobium sp. JYMT SZCCT0428]|uniref:hypothetical protein n=1 Tax=Bradyrhizobium sp. JYMT SZCCT0428 TaxID=2807673 RepID=UPI001BA5800F|nr:hypothetical protein [Bradyrhizobium sp. JYMT SZCCT0428]MBR1149275.1 hypothetical protein [Bradyrhizobium sp. JYMT SZCCT0428]